MSKKRVCDKQDEEKWKVSIPQMASSEEIGQEDNINMLKNYCGVD